MQHICETKLATVSGVSSGVNDKVTTERLLVFQIGHFSDLQTKKMVMVQLCHPRSIKT